MNNQAGRSDDQRVKEVYPEAEAQGIWSGEDQCWVVYEASSRITILGTGATEAEAWADAASRLPKAEVDIQCAGPHVSAFDCPLHDPRKASAPPVEEGEATPSSKDDPICQLPSCGHPLSMHDDGEGGCTAPSDFSQKDYGGDVGVQPSPCICSKFRSTLEAREVTAQTFEEWRETPEFSRAAEALHVPSLELGNVSDFALIAWNAAKASSPVVAGGESENVLDAAILRVLEQRCERGTSWDHAVL